MSDSLVPIGAMHSATSSAAAAAAAAKCLYDPAYFIRAHGKAVLDRRGNGDVATQVWDVCFEPDVDHPGKTTSAVATCGGNSIFLLDVNSGTSLMRFRDENRLENFYTLAWTVVVLGGKTRKTSLFVSGGKLGKILLFSPKTNSCYKQWLNTGDEGQQQYPPVAVNSLTFHSENPTWLFCSSDDGCVTLWDIGTQEKYDCPDPIPLLKVNPQRGSISNIVWTGSNRWLLAGCAKGLVGWHFPRDGNVESPRMLKFKHPENPRDEDGIQFVDALAATSKWIVASKCALRGLIYIWDLKETASKADDGDQEQAIVLLAKLRWSNSRNVYMNIGCNKGRGKMLACGDDKGSLWLYRNSLFDRHGRVIGGGVGKGGDDEAEIMPTTRMGWPELRDKHVDKESNTPCGVVINKVAISHDDKWIVAVTSNNLICLWKKVSVGN